MKIIQDITNVDGMDSGYTLEVPFDKGKKALEKDGYEIISLEQNARLRIHQGKDAGISRNGNWVREAFVYDQNTNLWHLTGCGTLFIN